MDWFETISQNCLALIIDRLEEIGEPIGDSRHRRQRQVIKGAIRNVLEAHAADGDLAVGDIPARLAAADEVAVAVNELLEWTEDAELIPDEWSRPIRVALRAYREATEEEAE